MDFYERLLNRNADCSGEDYAELPTRTSALAIFSAEARRRDARWQLRLFNSSVLGTFPAQRRCVNCSNLTLVDIFDCVSSNKKVVPCLSIDQPQPRDAATTPSSLSSLCLAMSGAPFTNK